MRAASETTPYKIPEATPYDQIHEALVQLAHDWHTDQGDEEDWHSAEDRLHRSALRLIADGCEDPSRLAALALQSWDMSFARWYA